MRRSYPSAQAFSFVPEVRRLCPSSRRRKPRRLPVQCIVPRSTRLKIKPAVEPPAVPMRHVFHVRLHVVAFFHHYAFHGLNVFPLRAGSMPPV